MSEDLDLELLALVDPSKDTSASSSSQRRAGSSKRRKQADDSDEEGEAELESEEDDDGVVRHASGRGAGPKYPLEGLFKDEEDKDRIYALPELEREEILAAREAEKQKEVERQALDAMFQQTKGLPATQAESVSGAAKRKHTATGTTSEKKKKLEELTKRRTDKAKRAGKSKRRSASPGRSSSSAEESSDDEAQRKDIASQLQADKAAEEAENITLADVQATTVRRSQLLQVLGSPWFDEFVTGSYVRVLAPPLPGSKESGYLVCEVMGVVTVDNAKLYSVDPDHPHIKDNRKLTLKHGNMEKAQPMNIISSGSIQEEELVRWMRACSRENILLPRKSQLVAKQRNWAEIRQRVVTDADISKTLARRKAAGLAARAGFQEQQIALNRKKGEYNMALKRQDWDGADKLAAVVRELEAALESSRPASGTTTPSGGQREAPPPLLPPAVGGDALWAMKERNKEVMRLAQEQARKEALAAGGPKKKARLEGAASGSLEASQPTDSQPPLALDTDDVPPSSAAGRGIPAPAWKVDRFGFGKVTRKLVLDLGPGF